MSGGMLPWKRCQVIRSKSGLVVTRLAISSSIMQECAAAGKLTSTRDSASLEPLAQALLGHAVHGNPGSGIPVQPGQPMSKGQRGWPAVPLAPADV